MSKMNKPTGSRKIPGYPGYVAAKDGSIWSCLKATGSRWHKDRKMVESERWKRLKPEKRKYDRRCRYTLRRQDGRLVRRYGSYFVLIAFIGSKPIGLEACHRDGDCTNDSPGNLRWGTSESNVADKFLHGTITRGSDVNTSKLSASDVAEIRRIGRPLKRHAEKFGVSEAAISAVINRKVWKHV